MVKRKRSKKIVFTIGRDLDVELPDQNPGQERPDDDPETEAPELDAADQEADREREEDRQLGIVPQRLYEIVHVVSRRLLPASHNDNVMAK